MPAAIIAGVGLAVTAVGTVATISAQNKAANAQKQQYAYERQIQQNKSVRDRRDAIRAARMTQGALIQTGANQGASDTSAALGGLGSIQSQLDNNLSFLDTNTSLANRAGDAAGRAKSAEISAGNWGAISNLGMAVFNNSGSIAKKVGG